MKNHLKRGQSSSLLQAEKKITDYNFQISKKQNLRSKKQEELAIKGQWEKTEDGGQMTIKSEQ